MHANAAQSRLSCSACPIMHHMTLFCRSGELTRADVPSGGIGVGNSWCCAFGVDLPCRRLGGAHGPAAYGPDGMRPRATVRTAPPPGNSSADGRGCGEVLDHARADLDQSFPDGRELALGERSLRGIAARTPCISQNAAVWRTSRT